MSLRWKPLPTANSIQAGSISTFDLPLDLRYHVVWLEIGDNGAASNGNGANLPATISNLVDQIQVKLNGKPQRTMLGTELNALNALNGAQYAAKSSGTAGQAAYRVYLPIFFAEPWRSDHPAISAPAWNVDPSVNSFQIDVKLQAGLVTPNITGWYEYDARTGPIGFISKWLRYNLGAVGTAQDFTSLDKKELWQVLSLFPTVEVTPKFVQYLKFTLNSVEIRDRMNYLENQATLISRGMSPDTSATPRFDLAFDYDDPINQWLNVTGATEMTLHVEYNAAAAGNLPAILQRVGPPE
jgi:hypothetical protein